MIFSRHVLNRGRKLSGELRTYLEDGAEYSIRLDFPTNNVAALVIRVIRKLMPKS
jgi:hypothetical protein